jgi:hypothetical protein
MIVAIFFVALTFSLKAIRDSTMINKGMEIAIKERLTADVV